MKRTLTAMWWTLGVAVLAVAASTAVGVRQGNSRPALDPNLALPNSGEALKRLQMRQQVDHPVTDAMRELAAGLEKKPAPDFTLPDVDGRAVSLSALRKKGPVLLFFVERDCPCCIGAKYFVDKVAAAYPDHLSVVAVINANEDQAKAWVREVKPEFGVVLDPMQKVIRAYSAESGVYTTLVAPDGTIDIAYPGYSVEMLKDVVARVARLAKVEPQPFISTAAPKEMTSGCPFPPPGE